MDGSSRATGAGIDLTVEGVTYILGGLDLDDFGIMENILLERRKDPLSVLTTDSIDKLPESLQDKVIKETLKQARIQNAVTPEETAEYMRSMEGQKKAFWLSIKKNHPEFDTQDKADVIWQKLLDQEGEEARKRWEKKVNLASGLDPAGNSTGLNTEKAPTES